VASGRPHVTVAERVDPSVFQDYAHYHRNLRIEDRATHNVVPLELNRIQKQIYNRIVRTWNDGRPARIIILKARREGVSTLTQSLFAQAAFTRRNVHALTVSHEDDSTKKLHAMTERMYEHLPTALKPEKLTGIRGKTLAFTHGSSLEVATAGGDGEVARSAGYTYLHLSEVAQYPNALTTLSGVLPGVPTTPGTVIIMESTAKGRVGRGAEFFQRWKKATEGVGEWQPMFFAWFDFPDYRMPVPDGFVLTVEESAIRDRFDLSLEQMAWRRHTIETDFPTDPERFVEEYPATPEEAFLHSGRPFFQPLLVQRLAGIAEKREPVFKGDLGTPGEYPSKGSAARPNPSESGRLRILEKPVPGHRYVLSVDPAGVLTSKEFEAFTDKQQARDFIGMVCVDRYTRKAVAYWHSRLDLGLVGAEAAKIGRLYANARIVVEMNGGYGAAPLDWLRANGYSNLHTRIQLDHERKPISEELGWLTSSQNRSRILEGLRDLLRDDPAAIAFPELAVEMEAFVEGDSGIARAAPGAHDDLVMAAAIAFEVVREYPQTRIQEEAA
jgi:hypothetical protein